MKLMISWVRVMKTAILAARLVKRGMFSGVHLVTCGGRTREYVDITWRGVPVKMSLRGASGVPGVRGGDRRCGR